MNFKKVGVVGCGLMGAGIAQVAAQAGYDTIVHEQKKLIQAKRDTANQQRNADERFDEEEISEIRRRGLERLLSR